MADTVRVGVFGAGRGDPYIQLISEEDQDVIRTVAVCDMRADRLESMKRYEGLKRFSDFDRFLEYGQSVGMNAVFLANFFHQHTPYAIRAMENGMDVVSECTASATLKECVELCRAVERTGRRYILAENYPFMTPNLLMKRLIDEGRLGSFLYAEGEYNHSGTLEDLRELTPFPTHWRAWMPRTYYVTHAMGPLVYMTGSEPRYVSARAAHSGLLEKIRDFRHNDDGMARLFCEMSNGMVASVTGCTAMASDYSRYRVVGDVASVEQGGYTGGKVRPFYTGHTKPADVEKEEEYLTPDLASFGEKATRAAKAGHGGGDFWIVQQMIETFGEGKEPFFDVYRATAMSAAAILGWRSCLNHGENFRIPDFRNEEERAAVEHDDLTPFPDENGEGATLPPSTYAYYGKY